MTLVAVIVLVPLCTWLTLQQVTPLYTATGSLIYEPSEYKLRELESIVRQDPTTEGMMASQAEILQSLHIAQRVAERGNLFDNPEFNATLRPADFSQRLLSGLRELLGMETEAPPDDPIYGPVQDPARDRTLLAVKDRLHASPVRFSHVIEVTFVAADPLAAAAAVNNAMDVYIKDQYAAKHRLVDTANELLENQARDLRRQVRAGEERMSAYRGEHAMSQGMHAGTGNEANHPSHRGSGQGAVGHMPPPTLAWMRRAARREPRHRPRSLRQWFNCERSRNNSPARCRHSAAGWAALIPKCKA